MQLTLLGNAGSRLPYPETPPLPLLKWIGSKQRSAVEIVSHFPSSFGTYYEPFLGSGAVLGTLAPARAVASDSCAPLVDIWQTLKNSPELLEAWYAERWLTMANDDRVGGYERIRASYNSRPNGADLLFLCRACYGGVVRFRYSDGHMSTPCGAHRPISPTAFSHRVSDWHLRVAGTTFQHAVYEEVMNQAQPGDLIYCDPPYGHSQSILYRAQRFSFHNLLEVIARCKGRGVFVALSIEGTKRSGKITYKLPLPEGLFQREIRVERGRSMLKRFQMGGRTLEQEVVTDRLLLTL